MDYTLRSHLPGLKTLSTYLHVCIHSHGNLTRGETSNADDQSCHCPLRSLRHSAPNLYLPALRPSLRLGTRKQLSRAGALPLPLPLPLLTHAPAHLNGTKETSFVRPFTAKKKEETKRTARRNNNSVCSKTSQTRRRTKTNPLMQEMPWSDCDRSQEGWEFEKNKKKKRRKLCQDAKKKNADRFMSLLSCDDACLLW